MNTLRQKLERLDRRGYKAYKELRGRYVFPDFELYVDRVQGDPFASPSVVRLVVSEHGFPPEWLEGESSVALCDYLARCVWAQARRHSRHRGTGHSGEISVPNPGQVILMRTAVEVDGGRITARLFVGLPAQGRTIDGHAAYEMFFMDIPALARSSLFAKAMRLEEVRDFIALYRDQNALRRMLPSRGLIAFVADGAMLPRRSGVSDKPLEGGVPFKSPETLKVEVTLPSGRRLSGMGIPEGTTLIVGGGYHGKTTLLEALQFGVYNHIPGDGREWVITRADAVKIRSEDGRSARSVDISAFISDLPSQKDTADFSTENASGSTSVAASLAEALEAGAKVLLFDEDTTATNFMIKDDRMVELIAKEPIVPLVDRVRELRERFGVSVVIAVGGAGEYLDVADTVILMENYVPVDATARAREVVAKYPSHRSRVPPPMRPPRQRIVLPKGFSPEKAPGKENIKVRDKTLIFGRQEIELWGVEQIILPAQMRAIGKAMAYMSRLVGRKSLSQLLDAVDDAVSEGGLSVLATGGVVPPDWAQFRRFELAAAINRMRSLTVRQIDET